MKKQKYLIAGGNLTLLVWDYPTWSRKEIIQKYLGEVDQIGFIRKNYGITTLEMMGGELCINAAIALASLLGTKGFFLIGERIVKFQNQPNLTSIELQLNPKKINNDILLNGIGFTCTNQDIIPDKQFLISRANKYSLPAFGLIVNRENKIKPYIFVQDTNSLTAESACGSGSIACSIVTGYSEIIHPTGQSILVRQRGADFIVGAQVVTI